MTTFRSSHSSHCSGPGTCRGTPTREPIGNFNPDWRGGQLFSVTQLFGRFAGVLEETAAGRCTPQNSPLASNPPPGYPLCPAETGLLLPGVNRVVSGSDTTYVPNQTVVDAQNRWLYGYFTPELHLVDASYVKLRELTLGYDLPRTLTNRLRVDAMTMATATSYDHASATSSVADLLSRVGDGDPAAHASQVPRVAR
jgi:hypothetical protein